MSDTYAAEDKESVIEVIEDALKAYITSDGDGVEVTRCYDLCGGTEDWEIVVTFSDGSYLSLDTPTVIGP